MNYANDIVYRPEGGVCQIKSLFWWGGEEMSPDMKYHNDISEKANRNLLTLSTVTHVEPVAIKTA